MTHKIDQAVRHAFHQICFFKGVIPSEDLKVLYEHKEQVTPLLLKECIHSIMRAPKIGNYYVGHFFSFLLLAQFKDKTAYALILKTLNLEPHLVDRLFGDALYETVPSIIFNVYDDNPLPLFILMEQTDENPILFVAGLTLLGLINHNRLASAEMLEEVRRQAEAATDPKKLGFLVMLAVRLDPESMTSFNEKVRDLIGSDLQKMKQFEEGIRIVEEIKASEKSVHEITDVAHELSRWEIYLGDKPVEPKIDENGPCPCGSEKTFRECCAEKLKK